MVDQQNTTDVVNAFFHRFYPAPEVINDWEMRQLGVGYGRECKCSRRDTIFPLLECADGFSMSVQGHFGAYSQPRDDFADHYTSVEIYELSEPEPLLNDWANLGRHNWGDDEPVTDAGIGSPAGYVPITVVEAIIAKHGGLK